MQKYKSTIDTYQIKKITSSIHKAKISSSEDAHNYIRHFYYDDIDIYESFYMLMLNRANNTTGYVKISQGGTIGTVVDIKLVLKYAIDSLSHHVIIAHNHPSGNVNPSDQDIKITRAIKEALRLLEISLLDHIILTNDNYYSFADNGLL